MHPVFLDIVNHYTVSLFSHYSHLASIFINGNSVKDSPNSPIASVFLPYSEKASSVAWCRNLVVVLNSKCRVFISPIKSNRSLNFSIVSELSYYEIVCVSATSSHFSAVSKGGSVFGRGSNGDGQICLGKGAKSDL